MWFAPRVWCYISRRFEGLWGTFWSSFAAAISVWIQFRISLWHKSHQELEVLISNNALFHLSPTVHFHQLLFLLISSNITYNKAAILPFESCDWCHEYQFFKCPEQTSYQLPSVTSHLVNTSVLQPSLSGNKRVLKWCNYHIITSLNNVP